MLCYIRQDASKHDGFGLVHFLLPLVIFFFFVNTEEFVVLSKANLDMTEDVFSVT